MYAYKSMATKLMTYLLLVFSIYMQMDSTSSEKAIYAPRKPLFQLPKEVLFGGKLDSWPVYTYISLERLSGKQ